MLRRGVGAIVFIRKDKKIKFLLLKRKLNWKGWEILKGGCKIFEKEKICLRRELYEETGFIKYLAKRTKYINKFNYERLFMKDNQWYSGARHIVYLVEVFESKVRLDKLEHSAYKWVNKKDALKLLTWKDQKEIFKKIKNKDLINFYRR